jgi:hypothetical protein
MLSKSNIYRISIGTQTKLLQEQNNFRYIAAINIKFIKRNRAIISYTPKKFSTILRKVFAVLGFLVQGVGVLSIPIKEDC